MRQPTCMKKTAGFMVETKTLFRKNKVPSFCNTYLYYALFFTKTAREFLTLFIAALICFLGIPCGVYYVIPQRPAPGTWLSYTLPQLCSLAAVT